MKRLNRLLVVVLLLIWSESTFAQHNYAEVLQKSIFFYEAQQSGPLPEWNRVSWRGDAFVEDGQDLGIDLNGGWFDAGDHVKFGFPMAATTTTLAWGGIEYRDAYVNSGQIDEFSRNLRFVTDYFLAAFINDNPGQYEFVGQIGDGGNDHSFWGAAEVANEQVIRPSAVISTTCPGSDIMGETSAALAAASIFFRESGDIAYADLLVAQAIKMYDFADSYRGKYSDCISGVGSFYNSWSGYNDEIVWGAIWLYEATGDVSYLQKAEAEYANLNTEPQSPLKSYKWTYNWDDKSYGCYVKLAQATGNATYMADAERWLDYWTVGVNGETVNYSPGGQAHLAQWGSLRYASNTTLLAFIYSDWLASTGGSQTLIDRYHDFGVNQMNYILGDNPRNSSYVVGYGNNHPLSPHHRTSHGGWQNNVTGLPVINRHVLFGALVGGPLSPDDSYLDDRGDFIMNEVACDYNAAFQGAMARMYNEFGGTPLANFPEPIAPTPGEEYFNLVKVNASGGTFTEVAVKATNHSAFPAAVTEAMSYRYYVDLSEGFSAGYTLADYTVTSNSSGTASGLIALDPANHIYYVEVSFGNKKIYPGGDNRNFAENQMRIALPNNAPSSAWDPTNDFSYQELQGATFVKAANIPFFEAGVLLYGNEQLGSDIPTARITASTVSGDAPLLVSFDGSTSTDPNGDPLTYSWSFAPGAGASGVTADYTFTTPGTYNVTLTVTDPDSNGDTESVTIVVEEPNLPPTAAITASTISGDVPLTVDFDGSGSSDPNAGDVLSYSWNFDDGSSSTAISPTHTFNTAGNYTVSLTVSDGRGGSDVETIQIEVIAVPNDPPIASLTVSGTSGESPFTVNFDGSGSTDPDLDVLTYSWDFGDGSSTSGATASNTYGAGTFVAVLTVNDGKGGVDTASVTINVTPGACNLLTDFGVPRDSGLPTINNSSYDYVYTLGTGAPDVSNIANFTINWANESWGTGLWQMSAQTSDGNPSWWNDLRQVSTNTFADASPSVTFTNSGFPGLDGTYYVNVDGGNFVLVDPTGAFAIYFSDSSTPPTSCATSARLENEFIEDSVIEVQEINIYPNPSNSHFILIPSSNLTSQSVLIYNALGQKVEEFQIDQNDPIQFGHQLKTGIYFLNLEINGSRESFSIIKN
ncbi:MAG: glycoside hydrolase family 9 protein [bacterium]|nr:glycoside hydrolase family 9 protein [bacterium]